MAVAKARWLRPLEEAVVRVTPGALVIGGGIAGIQAALDLADGGHEVYLVESAPSIGGKMAQLDKTFPTMDCSI
jgi:heterodisulfide reductase subunit A